MGRRIEEIRGEKRRKGNGERRGMAGKAEVENGREGEKEGKRKRQWGIASGPESPQSCRDGVSRDHASSKARRGQVLTHDLAWPSAKSSPLLTMGQQPPSYPCYSYPIHGNFLG